MLWDDFEGDGDDGSDHLGSTSTMSTTGGATVTGSTARYTPFGNWRTEPTSNLTDRGYTGHLHNNLGSGADNIGLIYMGARWYLPGLGRFISADTIVPDPANPQDYNRYSYVLNNPQNLIDPTGHCGADLNEDGSANQDLLEQCVDIRDNLENSYDITIDGEWRFEEMTLLNNAIAAIIDFFVDEGVAGGGETFQNIWNGTTIKRVDVTCGTGCTKNKNTIEISDSAFDPDRDENAIIETFAHELMHIWDRREGFSLARGLREEVGGRNKCIFFIFSCRYTVNDPSPASQAVQEKASLKGWNYKEDLAYTFAALVVRPDDVTQLRKDYFNNLVSRE